MPSGYHNDHLFKHNLTRFCCGDGAKAKICLSVQLSDFAMTSSSVAKEWKKKNILTLFLDTKMFFMHTHTENVYKEFLGSAWFTPSEPQ